MLKALLAEKKDVEQQMRDLQATIDPLLAAMRDELTAIEFRIGTATITKLAQLRALGGKEFGVVNLTLDGIKVAETIPKKVTWDQEKLNDLFDRIATAGDDPRAYMKVELKIGEKEYDKFGPEVKTLFAAARTVTPGKATIMFEEIDNA